MCRHPGHAPASGWGEGHGLGGVPGEAQEERPVARGGVLSGHPMRPALLLAGLHLYEQKISKAGIRYTSSAAGAPAFCTVAGPAGPFSTESSIRGISGTSLRKAVAARKRRDK